jgi:ABC-type phosphate/phosphonate transport system substrate-binding protein
VIGRKVEFGLLGPESMSPASLARGEFHAACLPGEEVPAAVRSAGFVPLGTLAVGEQSGVRAILVAPARTLGEGPEKLSGKRIAFIRAGDFAGFAAPVAALRSDFRLALGRNYAYFFTGSAAASLALVAERQRDSKFEAGAAAAAVDSDDLERAIEAGKIARLECRTLWKSAPYPALAFGRSNRLAPALAAKLAEGLSTFPWKDVKLAQELRPGEGPRSYVKIDYRRDFACQFETEETLARIRKEPLPAIPY